MKYGKLYKAYRAGEEAKRQGKPSNAPAGLTRDEKVAWRNGYDSCIKKGNQK